MLRISDIIVTHDSGFAVAIIVNLKPESGFIDTFSNVGLLKFNKCGKLEWGRYVPSNFYNISYNILEDADMNLYLCVSGLNGMGYEKRITVLKYDFNGKLLKYASFTGLKGQIINEPNILPNNIFLSRIVYLPQEKNDTIKYLSNVLTKLNTNLELVTQTAIGHKQKQLNGSGPIVIYKNNILSISTAYYINSDSVDIPMFSKLDLSLNLKENFILGKANKTNHINPVDACKLGDSIVTIDRVYQKTNNKRAYTSIKLYDKDLQLLKEVTINKNWNQEPSSLLKLANSKQFIVNIANVNYTSNSEKSCIYLYDKHLNPLIWPNTPPSQGYDFACKDFIPTKYVIDVAAKVTPVNVKIDTNIEDWNWLWALSLPEENFVDKNKNNTGLYAFPNPYQTGIALRIKTHNSKYTLKYIPVEIFIYDAQGKLIDVKTAMEESNGTWRIDNLNLKSGLYLIHIQAKQTGENIGATKIFVK